MNNILVKKESTTDIEAIDQLNRKAFGSNDEPKLIKLLRERNELLVSFVAFENEVIVGHICASLVTVGTHEYSIAGIGPLAVVNSHRKQGIGAMLMEQIILHLRANECIAAVLLGNPKYYPRFGFKTASGFGLHNEYGAVDTFMALELQPNALKNITGLVRYVSAFLECSA